MTIPERYTVRKIGAKYAKEYIRNNHYSGGSHNGPSPCYGLFEGEALIGCLMFATPCSENVRASLFGADYKDAVVELHRLHIKDVTPKNTESFFIGKCLRLLKKDRPHTGGVISFSDSTEGHKGTIYRASNFMYCGTTSKSWFYLDGDGRLRHPRQNGVNISRERALELGWVRVRRGAKNRFVYTLGRKWRKRLLLSPLERVDAKGG